MIPADRIWHYIGVGCGVGLVGLGIVSIYLGLIAPEPLRFWAWLGVLHVGVGLMVLFYVVPHIDAASGPNTGDTNRGDT